MTAVKPPETILKASASGPPKRHPTKPSTARAKTIPRKGVIVTLTAKGTSFFYAKRVPCVVGDSENLLEPPTIQKIQAATVACCSPKTRRSKRGPSPK
jgi:hypothetical protein